MKRVNTTSRRDFLGKMAPAAAGILAGIDMLQPFAAQASTLTGGLHMPNPEIFKSSEKKFVPVMITPFDANRKIDFDKLSRVIDFYLAAGAKGFFANCLSSEMFYMDDQERIAITRHVVKYVNGKVPVVSTGSFGETMQDKVNFAKKIHDTGADGVILITGHFAKANESDAVLMENFDRFFGMTGNMKLGTYECPLPYKRLLSPEVFKFLVANKRMTYHKDTSENIKSIETKLDIAKGSQMEFYNAHSASALASLQKGGKGMSPISGNFYPEIHTWLCENANKASKAEDAKWIQAEIAKMELVIGKVYPLSSKYFLNKRGLPIEVICRSKTKPLTTEQTQTLDEAHKVFLSWCERLDIKPVG